MGYRSDVWFIMNKAAFTLFMHELDEQTSDTKSYLINSLATADKCEMNEKGMVIIYFENTKWYPEFADVSFINSFVDKMIINEDDYLTKPKVTFLRIGEELDDCEQRYTDYPLLDIQITRDVNYDECGMRDYQVFNKLNEEPEEDDEALFPENSVQNKEE
jgi:hypothetical protein